MLSLHESVPAMLTFNLWHLFSLVEGRKLRTFVHGGRWCSELNSIVNFSGDVEGTRAYGTFVSCWPQKRRRSDIDCLDYLRRPRCRNCNSRIIILSAIISGQG